MPVHLEFDYDTATLVLENYSETNIKELQQWTQKLDKSTFVPKNLTNKQLLLFYNACDGDMDKIKTCIEKYYLYKRNAPEVFNHRVLKVADLSLAAEINEIFILPGKSCDGYDVIYYRLHNTDATKYDLESFSKLFFMVTDLSLVNQGPKPGYICLCDMLGVQFGHITKMNPTTLRKLFQFVQEAMLIRVKAIHIINAEQFIDKVMMIFKPFLNKEFYDMIKIHNKDEDLNKLYEIVPQSSLPSNYGGSLPDTQILHNQCIEQLKLLEPYFKDEEEQRAAALPDKLGENNLEGTFKKLEID